MIKAKEMAALFHGGCRVVSELAQELNCSERKVYRTFNSSQFRSELDELGYNGEIAFERHYELLKARVKLAYIALIKKDVPPRNRVGILMRMPEVQGSDVTRRSVENWRNQFDKEI